MKINNLEEANIILKKYVGLVSQYGSDSQSLKRLWPVLELVGNPHENLKVVHVAGTSGKTSTCYYIASLLASSGCKVGLTVSPHVYSITERVQINNKNISDELFCKYLGDFLDKINELESQPSYFELMIVLSLWIFAEEKVEYVVLETGMGGLLDGSNVVTRPDKVCVITDIGLDHMHVLGNTISEIAAQKAGIIQMNNTVVMHKQTDDVMSQVYKRAEKFSAKVLLTEHKTTNKKSNKLPEFQKRNWNLARNVAEYVAKRDDLKIDNDIDPNLIIVPGRMQTTVLEDGSLLIFDGAHNGQKITAFVSSFEKLYPGGKCIVLLSLKKGKEYRYAIDGLLPITKSFILTTFETSQDLPATSQDPYELEKYSKTLGITVCVVENHKKAYEKLLMSNENIKLVIGSFYLISQL